jgi:hypothetical protein
MDVVGGLDFFGVISAEQSRNKHGLKRKQAAANFGGSGPDIWVLHLGPLIRLVGGIVVRFLVFLGFEIGLLGDCERVI